MFSTFEQYHKVIELTKNDEEKVLVPVFQISLESHNDQSIVHHNGVSFRVKEKYQDIKNAILGKNDES